VSLVLIGPPGAGKSTVGSLVASALGMEFVDADEASVMYYEEAGWPLTRFAELVEVAGYERAHLEWEEALAYATPRVLSTYPDAVVALGAGHTHVTTPARQPIIRRALDEHTVVLLRPSQDLAASVAELRARCVAGKGRDWIRDGVDWLDRWSRDGLDDHLATETIYTIGRLPTQVASDVELAMTTTSRRPK
jgi:shikimate kinase